MATHGRKNRLMRHSINAAGWIRTGSGFGVMRCQVIDYSATGAQLELSRASDLPGTFTLSFALNDRRGRPCQIAWREGNRVGVKFTGNAEPVRHIAPQK
jgi:hypothetical protein